jgi:CheY-specific phosphatase CheX
MNEQIDDSVTRIMDSVMLATTAHFQDSLKINFLSTQISYGDIEEFKPRDMTVFIGISGPDCALFAFSFDMDLVNQLLEIETAGIEISSDELDIYRRDVLAETVNIVLGHSTRALAKLGEPIRLSPPIVLEDEGSLRRPKGAFFARVSCQSNHGLLDVFTISPKHLFGENLSLMIDKGVKS